MVDYSSEFDMKYFMGYLHNGMCYCIEGTGIGIDIILHSFNEFHCIIPLIAQYIGPHRITIYSV